MTSTQIVYDLLDEFGSNGLIRNWNMERRKRYRVVFGRVVTDMHYITSRNGVRRFLPDEEATVLEVEKYLERERKAFEMSSEFAQILYGKTDAPLSEQALEIGKAISRGVDEGLESALTEWELKTYTDSTGEYPNPIIFKRNADKAVKDAEEFPQFNHLVPKLREYRNFLDTLQQE